MYGICQMQLHEKSELEFLGNSNTALRLITLQLGFYFTCPDISPWQGCVNSTMFAESIISTVPFSLVHHQT